MATVMTAAGATRVNAAGAHVSVGSSRLRQRHPAVKQSSGQSARCMTPTWTREATLQSARVSLEIHVGVHVLPPSLEIDQS